MESIIHQEKKVTHYNVKEIQILKFYGDKQIIPLINNNLPVCILELNKKYPNVNIKNFSASVSSKETENNLLIFSISIISFGNKYLSKIEDGDKIVLLGDDNFEFKYTIKNIINN